MAEQVGGPRGRLKIEMLPKRLSCGLTENALHLSSAKKRNKTTELHSVYSGSGSSKWLMMRFQTR